MKTNKVVLLSAFKYVVPADYEAWFENLAANGWYPKKIGQWSSIAMTLLRREPKKYRYVVDMQALPKKDYKSTYEQFGWEFIGQMASAFVWRKEYTDKRPESFSEMHGLEERNKRFIYAVSVSFFMFLIGAIIVTVCFIINFKSLLLGDYIQFVLGLLLSYSAAVYLGFVMKKIYRNRQK